jgi:hypothetical protein
VLSEDRVYATTFPAIPETIQDYMKTSKVIVIGRIGKIARIHTFYGYQENASELERLDASSPMSLGLPMADYEIVVEEVIKADEQYFAQTDSPVILRVVQEHDPLHAHLANMENQGRFLLFMSRNPDNKTYGFYTFAHRVKLDAGKPRYLFEGKEFPILPDAVNGAGFVNAVRNEAQIYK